MENFWRLVVEKGRLAQWIICGGGILICLLGGTMHFLSADNIVAIFLALVAAGFGLQKMTE